jgi:putative addiction module killer protein
VAERSKAAALKAGSTASLFAEWFLGLDTRARQLVDDAVARMRLGNLGGCKRVGAGVVERRIDAGPGYRIYFGRDGDRLILLLAGSTKRRQQKAISTAQDL